MDNQKPNEGSARDLGREGAGSSMGKDQPGSRSGGPGNTGATGGSGGMAGGIADNLSKSTADVHKTIDKAADAAQPVVDRLASTAHASVDKMSGALTDASQRMDEKSRQLTEAYRHFADTGRDYVRSSPATSVLVALGAGYVLAKLLSRRA
jgi:ElaB/YqjD/DUF883 family membrane-anchored ribosome-binding protein